MDEMTRGCAECRVPDKICRTEDGKGPTGCPTKREKKILEIALQEYKNPDIKEFARLASVQEGSCYLHRDAKPFG